MAPWNSRLAFWALAAAGIAVASPAIAGHLIVRSAGPSAKSYPPGKQLPDSATIELQPGDSITLLGPSSTRTLRGPGSYSAGGSEQMALAANRRARFGALRTGELTLNPSPWTIDVSRSGKMCVGEPAKLQLWRSNSADALTLNITGSGGRSTTVDWPAGRSTLDWPREMPVEDGSEYQLQFAGSGEINRLSLATMPGVPADVQSAAQALIDRGCESQLEILVDGVDKTVRQ